MTPHPPQSPRLPPLPLSPSPHSILLRQSSNYVPPQGKVFYTKD
ncbi:hypothetical protein CWATWH0402_1397 [Crocosphaera watsonii WH 0402]|uniref:Uncharacterized protein n=1 Tax=Crocosphaera watsonii WH 0402 TaxID=1284629 RepID=T2K0Z7_CROWT|nr:hypothetical protein CWATWH0402_1397 [Crocosphaera watsonii WH 0402]